MNIEINHVHLSIWRRGSQLSKKTGHMRFAFLNISNIITHFVSNPYVSKVLIPQSKDTITFVVTNTWRHCSAISLISYNKSIQKIVQKK